jgi:hypothetical protein
MTLPFPLSTVHASFYTSSRFPLTTPNSTWTLASQLPQNGGYLRLGPDQRVFGLSMWHQYHCLIALQMNLQRPDDEESGGPWHVQHCLGYLRQIFLCRGDDALEPGDAFAGSGDGDEGFEFTRECRDWSALYDLVGRNDVEFLEFGERNASLTKSEAQVVDTAAAGGADPPPANANAHEHSHS